MAALDVSICGFNKAGLLIQRLTDHRVITRPYIELSSNTCFRVRARKRSRGRFVLHKNDSIAARNVMVLKGHISLMLQRCRDSV